jgi:hypothetical protein
MAAETRGCRALSTGDRDQEPNFLGVAEGGHSLARRGSAREDRDEREQSARDRRDDPSPRRPIAVAQMWRRSARPSRKLTRRARAPTRGTSCNRMPPTTTFDETIPLQGYRQPRRARGGGRFTIRHVAEQRPLRHVRAPSLAIGEGLAQQLFGIRQDHDPHLVATIGRGTRIDLYHGRCADSAHRHEEAIGEAWRFDEAVSVPRGTDGRCGDRDPHALLLPLKRRMFLVEVSVQANRWRLRPEDAARSHG